VPRVSQSRARRIYGQGTQGSPVRRAQHLDTAPPRPPPSPDARSLTGELVGRTRLRQLFSAPLRHCGRRPTHGSPFAGTRREMAAGSSTSAEPLLPGPVAFTSCCRRANAGAGRSASARWLHRGTPSRLGSRSLGPHGLAARPHVRQRPKHDRVCRWSPTYPVGRRAPRAARPSGRPREGGPGRHGGAHNGRATTGLLRRYVEAPTGTPSGP
jgi:hypothetical protein